MTLPEDVEINPEKIIMGCKPDKSKDGAMPCTPKLKYKGNTVKFTDKPIWIKKKGQDYDIIRGGDDLTVREIKALEKAMNEVSL